jgi:hypothetical protein
MLILGKGHIPSFGVVCQHLKKRFIHKAIFAKPSENRDFILSLPPDLAYNMAQLWIHFDKAEKATDDPALLENGEGWCDYLKSVCRFFDKRQDGVLYWKIFKPWRSLITGYRDLPARDESPVAGDFFPY